MKEQAPMPPAYRFNPASGEIRRQRRYVGSVRRAEDGVRWVGRIGQHTAHGYDASTAFREVSARAMGFANLAALRAANTATRARNRARRAADGGALVAALNNVFRRGRTAPAPRLSEADLIAQLQRGAIEAGETPLTAEQIRATWLNNGGVR
jgi:hypothetical protein